MTRALPGWVIAAVLPLTLAFAGCSGGTDDSEPLPVQFSLGFNPTPGHAGWYVGVEKGFYAEEGLDVAVVPGESSHATLSTLAAGAAELGSVDLPSLILAKTEDPAFPVTSVAPLYAQAPYAIFSLSDGANAAQPDDLPGVEIGVSGASTLDDLLMVWGQRESVSGFTFQDINPGAARQLLVSGGVPAVVAFIIQQPALEAAADEAGKELVTLNLAEWGMDDFYGITIVGGDAFLAEQPDAARAFVRASVRAWTDALENPEEAAQIMAELFPAMDVEITTATLTLMGPLLTDGGRSEIGTWRPEKVASTLEYLREGLGAGTDLRPEDLYTTEFSR